MKEKSLISEEPKHFVNTPEFSLFESESFLLVVDFQRLQITAKKQEPELFIALGIIAQNYIKLLPHIPYRSLGLNFIWLIELEKKQVVSQIELKINKRDLSPIFKNHEIAYGGIINARKEPYTLKLVIDPEEENALVNNFNFHHEIAGMSNENIISLMNEFMIRYEDSSRNIDNLYQREEK